MANAKKASRKKARKSSHAPETYLARWKRLQTLGFANYQEYLNSELWAGIRERAFAHYGRICRLCGKEADVIHHKGYGMAVLRGDSLQQLVPLCHPCHQKVELAPNGEKRTLARSQTQYTRMWKGVKGKPGQWGKCRVCGYKAKKGSWYCRPCSRGKVNPGPPDNRNNQRHSNKGKATKASKKSSSDQAMLFP